MTDAINTPSRTAKVVYLYQANVNSPSTTHMIAGLLTERRCRGVLEDDPAAITMARAFFESMPDTLLQHDYAAINPNYTPPLRPGTPQRAPANTPPDPDFLDKLQRALETGQHTATSLRLLLKLEAITAPELKADDRYQLLLWLLRRAHPPTMALAQQWQDQQITREELLAQVSPCHSI